MKSSYLFGYGSLICSQSRSLTCRELADRWSIPMMIHGLERMWCKRSRTVGMTAMGVRFQPNARCTGVLLPLHSQGELELLDEREKGYHRVAVNPWNIAQVPFLKSASAAAKRTTAQRYTDSYGTYNNENNDQVEDFFRNLEIAQKAVAANRGNKNDDDAHSNTATSFSPAAVELLSSSNNNKNNNDEEITMAKGFATDSNVQVWVYVPNSENLPSPQYPIVQSYVDTILRGCLDVGGEAFCSDFLQTTTGWHSIQEQGEENHFEKVRSESSSDKEDYYYDDDNSTDSDSYSGQNRSSKSAIWATASTTQRTASPRPVYWINDRSNPVYPNGDYSYSRQNAHYLDQLITKYRSSDFLAMRQDGHRTPRG